MAKGTLRVNGVLVASEIHKIVQESGDGSGGGTGVGDEILLETGFHILTEVSATAALQAQTGDNIVIREDDGTAVLTVDTSGVATFTGNVNVGTDDVGHDVKFHGATAGAYMLWDESQDDLIVGGAGRVGIGTTAPDSALHISAADVAGSGTSNAQLHIRDTAAFSAAQNAGIAFEAEWQNGSFTPIAAINASRDSTSEGQYGGHLKFNIRTHGANVSEAMRIDSSGKVGIGTTTPSNPLEIKDAGSGIKPIIRLNNNRGTSQAADDGVEIIAEGAIATNGSSTNYGQIQCVFDDVTQGSIDSSWRFRNYVNNTGTEVMSIVGGKVGIGTTSPDELVHVESGTNAYIQAETTSGTGGAGMLAKGTGSLFYVYNQGSTDNLRIFEDSGCDINISPEGRLGIGVQSPNNPLDVNYTGLSGQNAYSGGPGTSSFNICSIGRVLGNNNTVSTSIVHISWAGTNASDAGVMGYAVFALEKNFSTYTINNIHAPTLIHGSVDGNLNFSFNSSYLSAQSSGGYNFVQIKLSWAVLTNVAQA